MKVTNTQVYYFTELITASISFIETAPKGTESAGHALNGHQLRDIFVFHSDV